ncbi:MAG: hypothetical protein SFU21_11095 [Flavihumibacter sp.]|nr:hypothetical protein [Flavihumibacter sp.]
MKNNIFYFCLISVTLFSISCTKTSTPDPSNYEPISQKKSIQSLNEKRSMTSRVDANFNLRELSPDEYRGLNLPSFETIEEAKEYLAYITNEVNTNFGGQSDLVHIVNEINLPSPDKNCTGAGTYHAVLHGSGGMFSNFNAYFKTSSSSITTADFHTTGTNLGWSWSQLGSSLNGYSGCTYGTITWGVEIGGVVFGYTQNYHFSYTINPSNCTIVWTQATGICNSAIM